MGGTYDRRRSRSRSRSRDRRRSRSPAEKARYNHRRASRSSSPRSPPPRHDSHDRSRHRSERDKQRDASPHQHHHEHEGHYSGRHREHHEADRRRDAPDSTRNGGGREDQQQQRYPPPPGPPSSGPRPGPPQRGRGPRGGSPPRQGGGRGGGKPRWGKEDEQEDDRKKKEPSPEPDFGYSGKLVEEANKVNGVVCKYTEPPESRKPEKRWRLYIFKNNQLLEDPLYIHRQAWFMFGRERRLVDVPTDHPSCSKQHAVLQFRLVEAADEYGVNQQVVKPYLMDLGSVNGSFINGEKVEAHRYYELLEKDCIKFGLSSREYILLHENSAGA